MLNKRWITLPVVYRRSFASKAVFWAILKDFEFALYKILQNRSKNRFWGKRTLGKVIQRLLNIDLYTYLAIYRYI